MSSNSPASAPEAPPDPSSPPLRLLVVDDSESDREIYRRLLADGIGGRPLVSEECETGDAALERLATGSYDCVLLDYQLPDWDGLSLLDELATRLKPLPAVVLLTGRGDEATAVDAMKRGARDYLVKGRIDGPVLARAIQHAVDKVAFERQLEAAHQRLEELVEERTRELAATNAELRREMEVRRRAEEEKAVLLGLEQEARRQAEEANRLKDDFLATISHELRTPLNAILGWAAVLGAGRPDPATLERAVAVITRNSHAQAQLISDLLDMSSIVTGKLRLDRQPVDAGALLNAVVDTLRPSAAEKELALAVEIAPGLPALLADPARLQQVALNLLANAIKFTSPGGRVEVWAQRDDDGVEIAVSDDGIGIPPDFLPYVFDRFRQRDSSTSRRYSGLGLGLAIARHLVEAHDGSISAASEGEGRGATFRVRLPAAPTGVALGPPRAESVTATALTDVEVVLIEDDPDTREVCQRALEASGARVRAADSAAAGWSLLADAAPDVVVSDIGLPGEDGYSLLRRLRASSLPASEVPALALTAYASPDDAARARQAGYAVHLAKPVAPDTLVGALATLLGRLRAAGRT